MAMLSPAKPVRTRFRVAGEGAYELAADLLPALPRPPSSSPSITSARPPGSHASSSGLSSAPSVSDLRSSAATAAHAGSPLGLHAATKVALAPHAALVGAANANAAERQAGTATAGLMRDPGCGGPSAGGGADGSGASSGSGAAGGSGGGAGTHAGKDSSSSGSGGMFSLRKLSVLGSFAGLGGSRSSTSSPTMTSNSSSFLGSAAGAAVAPPPPVAAASVPDPGYSQAQAAHRSPTSADGGRGAPGTASDLELVDEDGGPAVSGVLAYNFADSVVVLDLACHSAFSTSPDVSLTLRMRSAPSAHALAHTADRLRLVVGCVNGEVAFWDDVGATYGRDALSGQPAKRSRSTTASAGTGFSMGGIGASGIGGLPGLGGSENGGGGGVGSSGGGIGGRGSGVSGASAAATAQSSQIIFNRDGNLNASRVVAVRWLPGPGFRFVAIHIDGALIVYDTRNKKAVAAAEATGSSGSGSHVAGGLGVGGGFAPGGGVASGTDRMQMNGYGGTPEGNGHVQGHGHGYGLLNGFSHAVSNGQNSANGAGGAPANGTGLGGGLMSSFAQIAEGGASVLGMPDKDRERSGLSERSVPSSSENGRTTPSHRRTGSQPLAQIGLHELSTTKPSRSKRVNPVLICHIGGGAVADAAFAPPCGATGEQVLLAIASRDGFLRIVDLTREAMVIAFRSYFGALLCASWSPDGRYVAAGGEDDLVSIWCPAEERIIARCEGHTSWVSAVAWDELMCKDGRYRLGSAGQDAKLLLWDFSLEMLSTRSSAHRLSARDAGYRIPTSPSVLKATTSPLVSPSLVGAPNCIQSSSSPQTPSLGATVAPSPERKPGKLARLRGHGTANSGCSREDSEHQSVSAPPGPVIQALGRAQVPTIEPVLVHVAHIEPLTDIYFVDTGVVTADCVGNVKLWARPPQQHIPPLSLTHTGKSHRGDLD